MLITFVSKTDFEIMNELQELAPNCGVTAFEWLGDDPRVTVTTEPNSHESSKLCAYFGRGDYMKGVTS